MLPCLSSQVSNDTLCLKLRMAAWEGDYNTIRSILDTSEIDIDCYAPEELNALGYAIEERKYEIVELLLSFGADPNKRQDITMLDRAVKQEVHEIAELLILFGADVDKKGDRGITPLIRAINIGDYIMVDMLLHYGANPDLSLNDSTSPLLLAAMYSDYEAAALLAGYGANVNKADLNGFTPLMIAAWLNDTVMALWLLEMGAKTEPVNYQGWDALSLAVSTSSTEMVKILLDHSSSTSSKRISNLTYIVNNKEIVKLVESKGYNRAFRPVIHSRHFTYGLLLNNRHLMGSYSIGLRDVRYNIDISAGFSHRYKTATIFHSISNNDSLLFQLQGKRFMVYTSIDKLFPMFEGSRNSVLLAAGLNAGYSWGSFMGTGMKPRKGFTPGLRAGIVWETKSFSTGLYYNQLQFNESPVPKEHLSVETSLLIPLKKHTVTPKKMPYVLTI